MDQLLVGAVADDLTGACDLASVLTEAGIPSQVIVGTPDADLRPTASAAVVALRTRTSSVGRAASDSTRAAAWLLDNGAGVLYQKYCSTFDSTESGNIGPVADALADLLARQTDAARLSVGTPATPAVGRTQYCGHLFVNGRLLSESSMREHPLTPMNDSDIVRVLARQSTRPVGLVPIAAVAGGVDAVAEAIDGARRRGDGHVLVDAISDGDLDTVARAILRTDAAAPRSGIRPVLIGGAAGLGAALARALATDFATRVTADFGQPAESGRRLVICGSASEQSRRQRAAFNGPVISVDSDTEPGEVRERLDAAYVRSPGPVLVEAASSPDAISDAQQRWGTEQAAALVERTLGDAAAHAVSRCGVTQLIVAGGETSGAVAAALGIRSLTVRRLAAPGVPWMTVDDPPSLSVAVLFKSGNFGGDDLFTTAWESAP